LHRHWNTDYENCLFSDYVRYLAEGFFHLRDHAGLRFGKWTLVMFWHTDCHVCHMQKPEISAFHNKHKDDDAHVIGVALDGIDGLAVVKEYIAENKPSFPSYVGHDLIIQVNYFAMTEEQFMGTPTYVLFDPSGQVVANKPGMMAIDALENFIARNS